MKTRIEHGLEHEPYCQPRPGAAEPRIEAYTAPRYGPDGVTVVNHVSVTRCTECGAAEYADANIK